MKRSLLFSALLLVGFAMSFMLDKPGYVVGDVAEDFSLLDVDGKYYSLSSLAPAKGYIVVFFCNHCSYSKMYEDRIIQLHQKYAEKNFPVVAISSNDPKEVPQDSYENMKDTARAKKYPFHYLFDESQSVAKAFAATRTPHVFVLDSTLTIRYVGAIDDSPEVPKSARNKYVEQAVDSVLAGKQVQKDVTFAVGCTIKWRR